MCWAIWKFEVLPRAWGQLGRQFGSSAAGRDVGHLEELCGQLIRLGALWNLRILKGGAFPP